MGGSVEGHSFKLFHEQFGYNGTDGGTHGFIMDLFIILTLEEEIGIFRQNSSNVVMCCIDMEAVFSSCISCCSFYLMMKMAGSTGTDVTRTFTSYGVMHSTSSSLI